VPKEINFIKELPWRSKNSR